MNRRIYLSGPITIDPSHAERFAEAAALITARGDIPVVPLDIGAACEDSSCLEADDKGPHGKHSDHSWACYMKADIAAMMNCDGVALLRRWEKSPGAQTEQFIARMVRMPVEELYP